MTRTVRHPFLLALAVAALLAAGCSKAPRFDGAVQFGDRTVSAAELKRGWEGYVLYCRACHGDDGDGAGPASPGLRPPPRDFRQPLFKFGWVTDGLPHDEDLTRIVLEGLHGTAMLRWDVPKDVLDSTLQFIKTFALEDWTEPDALGRQVVAPADPWQGRHAEAIARGDALYHGLAMCWSCHPAYSTREEIHRASAEVGNQPITSFRSDLYLPELKDSRFEVDGRPISILPPDFTFHRMRAGADAEALFRTIGAGIPGTAMPAWIDSLPVEDVWALAHYVEHLVSLRDTPALRQLQERLRRQSAFQPPSGA